MLAGPFGGKVDTIVMRFVDIMLAIPGLLLAISIAAMLGPSLPSVMIAVAVVNVPIFARLLRGSDAVPAAERLRAGRHGARRAPAQIVLGHILPNSLAPVIVQATLTLATAIIEAAGLSFLGLGNTDPACRSGAGCSPTPSATSPAPRPGVLSPASAIVIAALGFTLLGEALREALDPKSGDERRELPTRPARGRDLAVVFRARAGATCAPSTASRSR